MSTAPALLTKESSLRRSVDFCEQGKHVGLAADGSRLGYKYLAIGVMGHVAERNTITDIHGMETDS